MESSHKEEGLPSEKKSCSDCKTTKTPLWRGGPSGPKSLCNACGIRYRKKRPNSSGGGGGGRNDWKKSKIVKTRGLKLRDAFKVNLMALGKEVEVKRKPRQWGEVERAALLLMALSCGAVFA